MKKLVSLLSLLVLFTSVQHGTAQTRLLHYWNFNRMTTYHNPSIPAIKADYSLLDTNAATVVYTLVPGTSGTYAGFIDNGTGDTTNARLAAPAGQGMRVRNPSDSMELRINVPTTYYSNIVLKYALQNAANGQKTERFDYSTDGGTTWKNRTSGLTINGSNVDTLDATAAQFQSPLWGLVTIGFGADTTVNNNPRLVVRIRFSGNTTGVNGNNKFDNLTVEGGIFPRSITILTPRAGDTLISGRHKTITFSTTGLISKAKSLYYSFDNGRSYTLARVDTGSSMDWIVPQVFDPMTQVRVSLVDSSGIVGVSAPFTILPVQLTAPDSTLIHYWHFNGLSGIFTYPTIPSIPSDYSVANGNLAAMIYGISTGTSNTYHGIVEAGPGTDVNAKMNYPAGQSYQVDERSDSTELRFYIPTTNRQDISVHFAVETSNATSGPIYERYDYSVDSGKTWRTQGFARTSDTLTSSSGGSWHQMVLVNTDPETSDNTQLVFRLRFYNVNSGYVRLDNFSVEGLPGRAPRPSAPVAIHYWNFNNLQTAYHNPGIPDIKADYSAIDTNRAFFHYQLVSGAAANYGGFIDNFPGTTTNALFAAAAGQALRIHNPSDSMEYRVAIPATGYNNITLNYALQGANNGQFTELLDYSTNGGVSWTTSGLTVNGATSNTVDVTSAPYATPAWGVVNVSIGDSNANNNPNLMFRIRFSGNTSRVDGNNKIDNFAVFGQPGSTQVPAAIAVISSFPDTLFAGMHQTIAYTVAGPVTPTRRLEYTTNGGFNWTTIVKGDTARTFDWIVPSVNATNAQVRVRDTNGVFGVSPHFVILTPGNVYTLMLSKPSVAIGDSAQILWTADGYLGKTLDLDISYDNRATWTPIVHNYAFGSAHGFPWQAPMVPHRLAVIRITFASGAVGYSVPFNITSTASVGELTPESRVSVWPNPIATTATIRFQPSVTSGDAHAVLVLLDASGAVVRTLESDGADASTFRIDGSDLASGAYYYIISRGKESVTGSIRIQK